MRRDAGAIIPSFDLFEFVESTTIPAELYSSRVYQRLITSAANVVCWTNDLMTLEKELAHDDKHNFVPVLGHALAIPLEDSVEEVAARAGREVELFLTAEAELDRVFDALVVSHDLRAPRSIASGCCAHGCVDTSSGAEARPGIWRRCRESDTGWCRNRRSR
jgi:terpene synthase-like protein